VFSPVKITAEKRLLQSKLIKRQVAESNATPQKTKLTFDRLLQPMKVASPSRLILTPTASKLLADRAYDIEFHGYLSNHAKHAILALDRLQAPEERVRGYWEMYTSMTPNNFQLHKVDQEWDNVTPATVEQWKDWHGKKIHWQEQTMFAYNQLQGKYNGDHHALLKDLAPELLQSPSLAGALTHGIIHLGWGIDAQSPWMIAEGLAYLNFCAIGVDPAKIQMDQHIDDATPMDSLIRVADTYQAEALKETWVQRAKDKYEAESFHPELVPAGFQWQVAKVFEEAHPVATEMPTWLTTLGIAKLYESLYRAVTYLYLATRDENGNGSFLLLHLITSLWGLEQTLKVADDVNPEAKNSLTRKAIAQWYANLICFAATAGSGFPSASALQDIQQQSDLVETNQDPSNLDWTDIVEKGIAETEEHNIKLVYVARELWHRYGYWHGFLEAAKSFTITPDIGPDTPAYDA
jgi:Questin oxidase-like